MNARETRPATSAIRQAAGLLVLAALAAAVANATASPQRKLVWAGDYPDALRVPARQAAVPAAGGPQPAQSAGQPASAEKVFPPHPDKPAVEISGDDVALLHGRGALFIDARRSKVYEEGHIAGARSFPVWESDIDARVKALFDEGLDQSAPVVVYCSGGNCEDSHMLAQRLYMVGFDNVLVYKDGFPDWELRKGPIEKGPAK
jgi:rhodanese-related sulfurtransferase